MYEDEQQLRERISALADGQLESDVLSQVVTTMASSPEARATWHAYHVLGDVLRHPDLVDCGRDHAFLAGFRQRLVHVAIDGGPKAGADRDTAPLAAPMRGARVGSLETVVAPGTARQAANDAAVRWKWLAAAASVMTVAVLGWHVGTVGTAQGPQLAMAPAGTTPSTVATAAPVAEPPVMLRDPRLDELLAAHRQFGNISALQMPTGFLRNATFEQPGR